jgi:hypothetical protein
MGEGAKATYYMYLVMKAIMSACHDQGTKKIFINNVISHVENYYYV